MSTSIFQNCTFHSKLEHLFENCTETTNQCHLLQQADTIAVIFQWFNVNFCTFVFILAGILNVYTISIIFPLFLRMTRRSQKRYIFVLCRLTSSILAVIILILIRCILNIYLEPDSAGFTILAITLILDDFSFYSLMGSYIGMAYLIYLGVRHPWYYEHDVTLRHIIYMALGNYVTSIIISLPTGFFIAGIYTQGPFECGPKCALTMEWVNVILTFIAFGLTITILAYVLGALFYYQYKARRIHGSSALAQAKSKVGWTLFAIVLIALGDGIPSGILLKTHADNVLTTCRNFYEADHLLVPTLLAGSLTLIWAIVLFIDPIVSIISDELVKREIRSQMNWACFCYAKCLEWVFHGCKSSKSHNNLMRTLSERRMKF